MALPTGLIILWYGAIVDIPPGFVLCDGNNGTPDLRNQFIAGAGDTYDPDDSGGNLTHSHTFSSAGHFHSLLVGVDIGAGAARSIDTDVQGDGGNTNSVNHLPPYYALAYIMKT